MEIKGIDVSAYQGKIDWEMVADYGMGFAILRITEREIKQTVPLSRTTGAVLSMESRLEFTNTAMPKSPGTGRTGSGVCIESPE